MKSKINLCESCYRNLNLSNKDLDMDGYTNGVCAVCREVGHVEVWSTAECGTCHNSLKMEDVKLFIKNNFDKTCISCSSGRNELWEWLNVHRRRDNRASLSIFS